MTGIKNRVYKSDSVSFLRKILIVPKMPEMGHFRVNLCFNVVVLTKIGGKT